MSTLVNAYLNEDAQDGDVIASYSTMDMITLANLLEDYNGALQLVQTSPMTISLIAVDVSGLPSTFTPQIYAENTIGDNIKVEEVEISLLANNLPPETVDDFKTVEFGGAEVTFNPATNDTDPNKDTVTVTSVQLSDPTQGEIVLNPDGSVTFTSSDYIGNVTAEYTVSDGRGGISTGMITITVSDTSAPTQTTTITSITDDVAPATGDFSNGSTTNDTTPTLNGTISAVLDSNEVVAIYKDGVKVGTANVVNGTSWTYADSGLVDGENYTYTARVEDSAGNLGSTSDEFTITIDTSAPSFTATNGVEIITDANNDGFINASEKDSSVLVKINIDKAEVGDIITVSDNAGNSTPIILTATDIANKYVTTTFPNPAEGATITVIATISDPAGNTSAPATDSAKLDTSDLTANGGISVKIVDDADNNGLISQAELGVDGKITVEVTLQQNVAAGDKLILTATGNSDVEITLTQAQIDAKKVTVDFNAPANGVNFVTTAQVTDPALNKSNLAEDSATLKLDAPGAPVVVITEDLNNDGFINANELNGQVDVNVKAPAGTALGSTLIISDNTGNTQEITVTQDVLDNGTTVGFPAPAEGETIAIKAVVKDLAGNISSEGNDSAKLDTSNLTAGLKIEITEDENNDGYINQTELHDSDIDVKITLSDNASVGDTLTVTGSANTPQVITLTQAQINDGFVNVSFNPPSDGSDFKTTAQIKDIAGNQSNLAEDSARMQLSAPGKPIVTIAEDINNDGYINASELQGDINISVVLPGTAVVGDIMKLDTNKDGVADQTKTLTLSDIQSGSISFAVTSPGEGATLDVDAWVTDIAGNDSEKGNDSATIDTTSPSLSATNGVVITTDIDNDGYIDASEKGSSVNVQINIDKAEVGDIVTVKDNAGHSTPITLTAADIANGFVTTTFPNPAEGATITVTATIADKAGNVSAPATDSAKLDTNIPSFTATNGVEIITDANNDGFINASEKDSSVLVKINIDKAEVGDIITVSDNAGNSTPIILTAADIANKFITTTFPNPAEGATIIVTATISDPAGNTSAPATDSATLDVTAPTQIIDITSITEDTGINTSDFITDDRTLTINGTLIGTLASDEFAQISIDGGKTWNDVSVSGTTWSYVDSRILADGDYTYNVRVVDLAGNVGSTDTQVVSVGSANDAPTANSDTAVTDEDKSVIISVLNNDTDPDGDNLTVTQATVDASKGTVVVNSDGTITFTPFANYSGDAVIDYTVSDSRGGESSSTAKVTIAPIADTPTANISIGTATPVYVTTVSSASLDLGELSAYLNGKNNVEGTTLIDLANNIFGKTIVTQTKLELSTLGDGDVAMYNSQRDIDSLMLSAATAITAESAPAVDLSGAKQVQGNVTGIYHTTSSKEIFQDNAVQFDIIKGTNQNDTISVGGDLKGSSFYTYDGDDTIIGRNGDYSAGASIYAGKGNDTVILEGQLHGTSIYADGVCDNGKDNVYITGQLEASSIYTYGGDDNIYVKGDMQASSIYTGNGNDKVFIDGGNMKASSIYTGDGNDIVVVEGNMQASTIVTGSGNDIIALETLQGSTVNGESGTDIIYLAKPASSYYFELVTFGAYTSVGICNMSGIMVDHDTGDKLYFYNIEGFAFGDGSGLNTNGNTTTFYKYDVSIDAALTDTDGSEALTVLITGVPALGVLESSTYKLTNNNNGTWSVEIPQGTTSIADNSITLTVPSGQTSFELGITARATESVNTTGNNYAEATDSVTVTIPTPIDPDQTYYFRDMNKNGCTILNDYVSDTLITGGGNDTITFTDDIKNHSHISTGAGDDKLIGTSASSCDSEIKGYSTVDMGSGNDTLSLEDIREGSSVYLGSGNDTAKIDQLEEHSLLNAGDGDDSVSVKSIEESSILNMGAGNDTLSVSNIRSGTTIDGGEGYDIFKLTTSQNIDFNTIDNVMKNIEQIDLSVTGSNELKNITLQDVMSMTNNNGGLKITGTAQDKVDLSNEWTKSQDTDVNGVHYAVYTASGQTIMIENTISVVF